VVREARLLDDRRYAEWNALFTDDAIYWVPLVPGQPEGLDHTSHLYEDKLLRELRIERLKSPRAFSQQPPTRSLHLLQTPTVEPGSRRAPTSSCCAPCSSTPSRRATRSTPSSASAGTASSSSTARCASGKARRPHQQRRRPAGGAAFI
jgi:hypothetical protein